MELWCTTTTTNPVETPNPTFDPITQQLTYTVPTTDPTQPFIFQTTPGSNLPPNLHTTLSQILHERYAEIHPDSPHYPAQGSLYPGHPDEPLPHPTPTPAATAAFYAAVNAQTTITTTTDAYATTIAPTLTTLDPDTTPTTDNHHFAALATAYNPPINQQPPIANPYRPDSRETQRFTDDSYDPPTATAPLTPSPHHFLGAKIFLFKSEFSQIW
jgi:hypothetical protein